ncbi:hypothetical protein NL676_017756 [Syzygium grande]|nr:hypothetical protein NL676_017756 [Syzygium grande]
MPSPTPPPPRLFCFFLLFSVAGVVPPPLSRHRTGGAGKRIRCSARSRAPRRRPGSGGVAARGVRGRGAAGDPAWRFPRPCDRLGQMRVSPKTRRHESDTGASGFGARARGNFVSPGWDRVELRYALRIVVGAH